MAAILIAGLMVRLHGISFGLPYLYDPDEPAFVDIAINILRTSDFNPHWFGHPGTTSIYLLVVLYALIYLGGLGFGVFSSPADFRILINSDPTLLYMSGRLVFALIGVATIFVVYLIARRLFNKSCGLIAATFCAFSPQHVFFYKLVRSDILMTFFLSVAFLFCLGILRRRGWSDYLLAGLVTGFAIATKYPAVVMCLVIVIAHVLGAPSQWKRVSKLLGSGFACILGAFLASPFMFLDFKTMLHNVSIEGRTAVVSFTGEGVFHDFAWYFTDALWEGFGAASLVLAGIGMLLCVCSKQKDSWLLLSFPLLFLFFISTLTLRWSRWVIPVLPFLCVLAAYALHCAGEWAGKRWGVSVSALICTVLTLGVAVPLVKADLENGRALLNVDTRTVAREWMMQNIPAGSRVLLEQYSPHLPKDHYVILLTKEGTLTEVDTSRHDQDIFGGRHLKWSKIGKLADPRSVFEKNVQYMVLTSWQDRYSAERDANAEYARIVATYETLVGIAENIYEIAPHRGARRGPRIRVYSFGESDNTL